MVIMEDHIMVTVTVVVITDHIIAVIMEGIDHITAAVITVDALEDVIMKMIEK